MSTRARRLRRTSATERVEIEQALDALSAPQLRAVVRAILDDVDEDVRTTLVDRLLAQATRGSSGWDVRSFVAESYVIYYRVDDEVLMTWRGF